jgi:thiamine pyrophosphate-dependent acetolactate synthase large subunit-like protein
MIACSGQSINIFLCEGLAASLSASRQVLVVAGDGGFQMSLNELATLKGDMNVICAIL